MRFCRAAIRADLSRDLTLPTNRLVPIVDAVQPLSAKTFAAAIRGKSLTSSATCAVSREVGSDGSRARRLSARHMQSSSSRLTPNLTVNQNCHFRFTAMMMPRARGAMTSTRLALLVPGQKPIDYSEHIMNMRLHAQAQRRAHSGRNRPDVSTPDSAVCRAVPRQTRAGDGLPRKPSAGADIRSNATRIGITMSFASLQSRARSVSGTWRGAVRSARQGRAQTG